MATLRMQPVLRFGLVIIGQLATGGRCCYYSILAQKDILQTFSEICCFGEVCCSHLFFFSIFLSPVPPPRDSTIAVAIGASVGGILALLILSMVVVKCIRRHKNQELISDEQKMEEEGKVDGEGGTEEATK